MNIMRVMRSNPRTNHEGQLTYGEKVEEAKMGEDIDIGEHRPDFAGEITKIDVTL